MKTSVEGDKGLVSVELRSSILSIAALIMSFVCVVMLVVGRVNRRQQLNNAQVQYVLHVGTTDKDTLQQIPTSQAREVVKRVLVSHFDNFKLIETDSSWVDDAGNLVHEPSFMCIINGSEVEEVHKAASELNTQLNLDDILIEHDEVANEYYSGRA